MENENQARNWLIQVHFKWPLK